MFSFPDHCRVDKPLTIEKICKHVRLTKPLKAKFIEQVEQILWKYKLAADTLNLPERDNISEIHVLELTLRVKAFSIDIPSIIDKAVPYPLLFIVRFGDEVKNLMAFKKINPFDTGKITINGYFESDWLRAEEIQPEPLPVILDMLALYEELMYPLINLKRRNGETMDALLERALLIQKKERALGSLESKTNNEKQFNHRVELNSELKKLHAEIKLLSK